MADNNLINIENEIIQKTSSAVYYQEKGNIQELIQNAKNFLNNINFINNSLLTKGLKQQLQEYVLNIEKDNTTLIYSYIATFETQINLFLGRTIYLTYVTKQGDLKLYDDFEIFSIYSQVKDIQQGKGRIRADDELNRYTEMQNLQLIRKIQNSLSNKKRVYTIAIERYDKPADLTGQNGMRYKINGLSKTFYFRLFDHFINWSCITSRGQIAQAYSDAVINEDISIDDSSVSNLEYSLYRLSERLETVNAANSISALLKGDITLESNGNIQFAIKSRNLFNAPAIRQYIIFAYNIIFFKDIFLQNPEKIQKNLEHLINSQVSSQTMAKQLLEVAGRGSSKKIQEQLEKSTKNFKIFFNLT